VKYYPDIGLRSLPAAVCRYAAAFARWLVRSGDTWSRGRYIHGCFPIDGFLTGKDI